MGMFTIIHKRQGLIVHRTRSGKSTTIESQPPSMNAKASTTQPNQCICCFFCLDDILDINS